jgi:activator of HSP90 ATPase
MTKAIQQTATFRASPEVLYELYMNSKKHSAATGAPARLSRKVGGRFTAHGGALNGRNLLLVPGKMIVQSWRSTMFKKGDPDSILVLRFTKKPGGARVDMVHSNVPAYDHAGVRNGWPHYYWQRWAAYLKKNKNA